MFYFYGINSPILPPCFFLNFSISALSPSPSFHICICSSFPVKRSNQWARLPVSKDLLSMCRRGRILGCCVPRLAFSGSATLKATVKHNITLTKRSGQETLESAETICGLLYFFFTVKKVSLFLSHCYTSSTDKRKTLKWFKPDVLCKEWQFSICTKGYI